MLALREVSELTDSQHGRFRRDALATFPLLAGVLTFAGTDVLGMDLAASFLGALFAMIVVAALGTAVIVSE